MDPRGKTVIVTGASSGIGAATARAFSAAGARVVLVARDRARLETVARSLGGAHIIVPADVTDQDAGGRLVQQALDAFSSVDILINNAGVGVAAPIERLSHADLQQALAVNLFGPIAITQAVLPHMRSRGRGQLIFVSSVVGLRALPYLGGYAATKAALDRVTESLRVELRGSGIAVTLVRPGTTRTGFSQRRLGIGHERRRASQRGATPEQVAGAILRAAAREPRVAYVRLTDRLIAWVGLVFPRLTDRLLARSFSWEDRAE